MTRGIKRTAIRETVASNVRRHRQALGVSQERLGELAGLHRTYVSHVERAQSNITVDNLEVLADALGVQPQMLLEPVKPEAA